MDEVISEKRCTGPCGRLLPATKEFFYVHARRNGRKPAMETKCKSCYNKAGEREQKKEKEFMRMEEQGYVSTTALAKQIGISSHTIAVDIHKKILPAKRNGSAWSIRYDDAQEYAKTWENGRRKGYVDQYGEYISARELGRRTGQNHDDILDAIHKRLLPASRNEDHRRSTWRISKEDARAYSERMGWTYIVEETQSETNLKDQMNGHSQEIEKPATRKSVMGTPNRCGSCGTERGNILGDIDKKTHEKYGYLCARCHRLVQDFHGDITRMHKVLAYIERTRFSHV